jgi:hypothetical protein
MAFKKKILAFAMLLLAAAPLFFILGHLVKRELAYHQMMEKLENNSLHTISIPLTDINWIKKNKEVMVDGKLFDVKSWEIIDGQAKLVGLFDDEETKLEKEFNSTMQQNNNQQAPINQLALKFIFNFLFINKQALLTPLLLQNCKPVYLVYNEDAVALSFTINTPPPNC